MDQQHNTPVNSARTSGMRVSPISGESPVDKPTAAPSVQREPQPLPEIPSKASIMIPAVLIALVLSVGLGFLMVSFYAGGLQDDLKKESEQRVKVAQDMQIKQRSSDDMITTLNKRIVELETISTEQKELIQLLKSNLEETTRTTLTSNKQLEEISTSLIKIVSDQDRKNTEQDSSIANVQKRMGYVEQKIAKLDKIEADVESLKTDTGNLKGEYVALRQDLNAVRDKGLVTESELNDLTERSRVFQLKILAARAREAAEAAKSADLKKLLARLTE